MNMPKLQAVQIQTTSFCTTNCIMCPQALREHKDFKSINKGNMSDRLFIKILEDCKEMNVKYIAPYLMADPLMDPKIFERIEQIREICGNDSFIELSISPTKLDDEIIQKLLKAPLSLLRISFHGLTEDEIQRTMPGMEYKRSIKYLHQLIYLLKKQKPYKFEIAYLRGIFTYKRDLEIWKYWEEKGVDVNSWWLISRAGNAFPGHPQYYGKIIGCKEKRAEHWAHILSDGTVILCCNDYQEEVVLGNVKKCSLRDIWTGAARQQIFEYFQGKRDMPQNFLCKRCEWAEIRSLIPISNTQHIKSKETNTIAVITLTRKRPHLLLRAIKSVQNQIGNIHIKHIILVDDDDKHTIKMLQCLEKSRSLPQNVVWYCVPRNKYEKSGPSRSAKLRNYGVRVANTSWIAFLDDDNEWLPYHLDSLLKCAIRTGVRVVHSYRYILNSDGSPFLEKKHPWYTDINEGKRTYSDLCKRGIFVPGTCVMRDRVDPSARPEPFTSIDISEALFAREILLDEPFEEHYTEKDALELIGEDDKLFYALMKKGEPIVCTHQATLMYYLGGYSNNPKKRDELEFSWATTVDKGGR